MKTQVLVIDGGLGEQYTLECSVDDTLQSIHETVALPECVYLVEQQQQGEGEGAGGEGEDAEWSGPPPLMLQPQSTLSQLPAGSPIYFVPKRPQPPSRSQHILNLPDVGASSPSRAPYVTSRSSSPFRLTPPLQMYDSLALRRRCVVLTLRFLEGQLELARREAPPEQQQEQQELFSRVPSLIAALKDTRARPDIFDLRLKGAQCTLWTLYPAQESQVLAFAKKGASTHQEVRARVATFHSEVRDLLSQLHGQRELLYSLKPLYAQLDASSSAPRMDPASLTAEFENASLALYLALKPCQTTLNSVLRMRESARGWLSVAARADAEAVAALQLLRDFPRHYAAMERESRLRALFSMRVLATGRHISEGLRSEFQAEARRREHFTHVIPAQLRHRLGALSEANMPEAPRVSVPKRAIEHPEFDDLGEATSLLQGRVDASAYEERIAYLEKQLYRRESRFQAATESMRRQHQEREEELRSSIIAPRADVAAVGEPRFGDRVVFVRERQKRYVMASESTQHVFVLSEALVPAERPLYLIGRVVFVEEAAEGQRDREVQAEIRPSTNE